MEGDSLDNVDSIHFMKREWLSPFLNLSSPSEGWEGRELSLTQVNSLVHSIHKSKVLAYS
jgi:hypothetical protein